MKTRRFIINCVFFFVFFMVLPYPSPGDPLDNWHWRNPLPPAKNLSGVAWGDGKFVAVGEYGTVFTSPDGATWDLGSSGNLTGLWDVVYGNGLYVAVGNRGRIMTSPDGIAWMDRDSGTGENIFGVTYGNGRFVAVGNTGVILTSCDGTNWEVRRVKGTSLLSDVACGNGTFVAVGFYFEDGKGICHGKIFTSHDGVSWKVLPRVTDYALSGVIYGNETFVAAGADGTILTSPDGLSWTIRDSKVFRTFVDITYGKKGFVAVGTGIISSSLDGETWQNVLIPHNFYGVTYGNDAYVAVGNDCAIFTSSDGVTWAGKVHPAIRYNFGEVVYGNDTFVATAGTGMGTSVPLTSGDGRTWVERSTGGLSVYDLAYGNGTFVGLGDNMIFSSPDGITWNGRYFDMNKFLLDVAYGNGMFIATGGFIYGGGDAFLTSPDGMTWSEQRWLTEYRLNSVTYANGVFAIGCNVTNLFGDGVTWTERKRTSSPFKIAYGNGIFVGIGDGKFWISSNGIDWNPGGIAGTISLYDLDFGGNSFVAVGRVRDTETGVILTSEDGVKWTVRFMEEYVPLTSVSFGQGTFVAVGEYGIVLQSDHVSGPGIAVDPTSIDFGRVLLGDPSEKTVKVWNDRTEDLVLGNIGSPSPPFTIVTDTCSSNTLIPGASCAITVRFTSVSIGTFTRTMNIPSNDPDRPNVAVNLSGTSVAPDLKGQWGTMTYKCTSKCKIKGDLAIQNVGNFDSPSSYVRFYLSEDGMDYTEDGFLKQVSTGKIKAGATKAKKFGYSFPAGESASGKYIVAVIDPNNTVTEADETNNMAVYGPIP